MRLAAATTLIAALALPVPLAKAAEPRVPSSAAEIQLSFAPVVRRAAPAVVNIYTTKVVQRRMSPFAGDPFFERFFGEFFPHGRASRQRVENSLGSGVIVEASGLVVSNHHVVGGADEITVVLTDRREFSGKVVFADEASDLAVVALDGAEDLPVLDLRNSDDLEVGDLVLAIGNPFGVGQTVTSGIVSGVARSTRRGQGYFIQTDAAINPGNSGGALVDMDGRLIGVNTQILSRSGGSNGIGFAVPANLVARVIDAALAGEDALARPWLGVGGQPVTAELADALGVRIPRGVLIDQLHPASPFAAAGLETGDVLLAVEGERVDSPAELNFRTATLGTGREAEIEFLRRGQSLRSAIALAPAPNDPARDGIVVENGVLGGLELVTVNPAVIEEAGLPLSAEGILVVSVRGAARRTGVRRGDVIVAVADRPVRTTGDFRENLPRRAAYDLEVVRGGRSGLIRIGR
ncbi:MAG: Do family serine endopeptidase [Pseudomonadota bacterium]